jgi:hypothetical protein
MTPFINPRRFVMPTPFVTPNLFHLSGQGRHITYATSGLNGQPHLHYQDSQHNLNFSGDQVRTVACDLGTVVSVTIQLTVDAGSSSFSMLIPRMHLRNGETGQVRTEGILTIHRFSLIPALSHGQLDLYTATPLQGTAQHVLF